MVFLLTLHTDICKSVLLVTKIIISLGSNAGQEQHMRQARGLLSEAFPGIVFSPLLWTSPVGMPCGAAMFQNGLAVADTCLGAGEVQEKLKAMERLCGRRPGDKVQGVVVMDIDLLQYGEMRLHERDWQRPYVARLLAMLDL